MKKKTITNGTDLPHFFTLKHRGNVLFYFGARHSSDPAHPQFILLEKRRNRFLKKTAGADRIALVEGGTRPIMENKVKAREGGEACFITFLAANAGVETRSPEPDMGKERGLLLKMFSREEVQYHYFARAVSQWHRFGKASPFPPYIRRFLSRDKRVSRWPGFDFSLAHMKAIHRRLFRSTFHENNAPFFGSITNPTFRTTIINCVAAASGAFRDRHIVHEIKKLWTANDLFIVYGRSHAFTHEPILRNFARPQ